MDDNNDTPQPQGAPRKQNKNNLISRLSPLRKLTLQYILEHPRCNRWELGAWVESGYAPDIIQYIRKAGIRINTEMVKYKKRSGVETEIGLYSVDERSIKDAEQAVYGG